MGEVSGSVQWIDDPTMIALDADEIRLFFRQYGMSRKISLQYFNDPPLGFPVNGGHQVDSPLVINFFWLVPAFANKGPGRAGSFPGDLEKFGVLISHIEQILRNRAAAMLPNDA